MGDDRMIGTFGGDRQHSLNVAGVFGMTQCCETEQRMDRGQARIPGADAVAPVVFEVVEEGADHGCVDIAELQTVTWNSGLFGGETQQRPEPRLDKPRRCAGLLAAAGSTVR